MKYHHKYNQTSGSKTDTMSRVSCQKRTKTADPFDISQRTKASVERGATDRSQTPNQIFSITRRQQDRQRWACPRRTSKWVGWGWGWGWEWWAEVYEVCKKLGPEGGEMRGKSPLMCLPFASKRTNPTNCSTPRFFFFFSKVFKD